MLVILALVEHLKQWKRFHYNTPKRDYCQGGVFKLERSAIERSLGLKMPNEQDFALFQNLARLFD